MSEAAAVAIIVGVISAVPGVISAWATIRGNQKLATVHVQINSRMDELLRSTAKENLAVGQAEGRASADQRTDLLAEKSEATLSLLKTHDEWERERLKDNP